MQPAGGFDQSTLTTLYPISRFLAVPLNTHLAVGAQHQDLPEAEHQQTLLQATGSELAESPGERPPGLRTSQLTS
jgi:hypothetical protein